MATTTTTITSEKYDSFSEHSIEDIKEVKRLADEEQARRINDTNGEAQRKMVAHNVSDMFSLNTRSNWFQQGSSFVFQLLNVAREKASNISAIAAQKGRETASDVKQKLDTVSYKGKVVAQDVKVKVTDAGKKGIQLSTEMTSMATQKSKDTANDIKSKVTTTTQDAQNKGAETLSGVQNLLKEKLGTAQATLQGAALKIKSSSLNLWEKVNTTLTKKTNLAFLLLEEETERAYRMNSETQVYAILNALSVSFLIKDIGYEFYRPASEPSHAYATKMLEQLEQSRRIVNDMSDQTAVKNAKAVSDLIVHKFRAITPPPAALVAAKAEVIAEIDHQGVYVKNAAM